MKRSSTFSINSRVYTPSKEYQVDPVVNSYFAEIPYDYDVKQDALQLKVECQNGSYLYNEIALASA